MCLQGVGRGLGEEGHEAELDALASLEVGLRGLAQPGDAGDVDLDDGGQLSGHVERLHHPLGDHRTQTRHLLGLAAQRAGS
jgi:hypothetical protein